MLKSGSGAKPDLEGGQAGGDKKEMKTSHIGRKTRK